MHNRVYEQSRVGATKGFAAHITLKIGNKRLWLFEERRSPDWLMGLCFGVDNEWKLVCESFASCLVPDPGHVKREDQKEMAG